MAGPYKVRETMKYTETVYYDEDGNVVGRERNHDDWTYAADPPEPLTESELEDYFPNYEE